jgi:hypothetical protein
VGVDVETHVISPLVPMIYASGLDGLWTEFAPAE